MKRNFSLTTVTASPTFRWASRLTTFMSRTRLPASCASAPILVTTRYPSPKETAAWLATFVLLPVATCVLTAASSSSKGKSSTTFARRELVAEPFQRLLKEKQLIGYTYDGFWKSMDTFKDRQLLKVWPAAGSRPGKSGRTVRPSQFSC